MKAAGINTVCFIGGGTMGCFNSLLAAAADYDVVMYDISAEALERAGDSLREIASLLAVEGLLQDDTLEETISRICLTNDLDIAVTGADLVSESVPERLEIKRDIHRRLDEICSPHTLITTNTSSFLGSEIEDVLERGDRFAALHSHLGATVFDVVAGPRTSAETISTLVDYVRSVGGFPLVLNRENPGYVINAILGALLTVSQLLVIEGVAGKEDIDRVWMRHQHAAIGPFGLMDLFGLNVIHDSWQHPKPQTAHLQEKILGFIAPYIESGSLGAKTGKGFYTYPDPDYARPGFLDTETDLSFVYRVMVNVLVANAILIAANDVADPREIDSAWITSFKVPAGPFGTLDKLGLDEFLDSYRELAELGIVSSENLPHIAEYLDPLINSGKLGVKTGEGFYVYPNADCKALNS